MPAAIIAPEEEELVIGKKPAPAEEPKPVRRNARLRDLLTEIFAGHEEFLGWTPD